MLEIAGLVIACLVGTVIIGKVWIGSYQDIKVQMTENKTKIVAIEKAINGSIVRNDADHKRIIETNDAQHKEIIKSIREVRDKIA